MNIASLSAVLREQWSPPRPFSIVDRSAERIVAGVLPRDRLSGHSQQTHANIEGAQTDHDRRFSARELAVR